MQNYTEDARIIPAIEAIQRSKGLSHGAAEKLFNFPESTLRSRMNGYPTLHERRPAAHKFCGWEEEVIIRYLVDLNLWGFELRLAGVEDMANYVHESQGWKYVEKLWVYRFVRRWPELKTKFNRVYDLQRAFGEDPEVLGAWFGLVENTRVKNGVVNSDVYNSEETGSMMSVLWPGMVVTRKNKRGRGIAILWGDREWAKAIIYVNSEGYIVPPFLVVQWESHLANWYTSNLSHNWVIKPIENRWTNNKTSLE